MKKQILSLLALFLPLSLLAGPVSPSEALQKAKLFVSGQGVQLNGPRRVLGSPSALNLVARADSAYYIYNIGKGKGYVVVSGSDRTQAILGYADKGQFDPQNLPEALRGYLRDLQTAVKNTDRGLAPMRSLTPAPAPRKTAGVTYASKNAIAPLVPCHWNQGEPYNGMTPWYIGDKKDTIAHSATGCVATAMAQIMYYWKWPETACKTIPAYSSDWNIHRDMPALQPVTFAWDQMENDYNDASSQEAKDAVAQLMFYVGCSVQMGYGGASGAGAGNTAKALRNYYGYNKNLFYTSHDSYTYREWEDLIYGELAAGRPVLINGDNYERTGGHEWVCDGYDGNGLFHMNWGWGGMSDGYFLLTVMVPGQQGIGGSTASDGYSMGHGIVVGLQPETIDMTEAGPYYLNITSLYPFKDSYARNSGGYFRITMNYSARNPFRSSYSYDGMFSVYNDKGELVKDSVLTFKNKTFGGQKDLGTLRGSGNLGNLTDGIYYIKFASRQYGQENWIAAPDADVVNIKFCVKGDSLFVTDQTLLPQLIVNDFQLVGPSTMGQEQKVRVNVTNPGSDFYSDLYLCVDSVLNKPVSGNTVYVPAKSTMDLYFKYKPASYGSHSFQLETNRWNPKPFYSTRINVQEGVVPNLTVKLSAATSVVNSTLYGQDMLLRIDVKNATDNPYVGKFEGAAWEARDGYVVKLFSSSSDVVIPAKTDTTLYITLKGLNYDKKYYVHIDYRGAKESIWDKPNLGYITVKEGSLMWYADGHVEGSAPTRITATKDVVAVSLTSKHPGAKLGLTDETNPNLIVYMEEGATLSASALERFAGKVSNFVYGSEADTITIHDGHNFYVPKAFTAKRVVYQRPVAADVTAANGWTTLTLPFKPETVTADGEAADWFHATNDKDKDFVVQEFNSINGDEVRFADVDELLANRPYIMQLAGERDGKRFSLAGKTLEMAANLVNVEKTQSASTYTPDFKLVGTVTNDTIASPYLLSADGKTFTRVEGETPIDAFRAYFVPVSESNYSTLYLQTVVTTGISGIQAGKTAKTTPIYNMNGVRVGNDLRALPHGVYIVGGRKVVK